MLRLASILALAWRRISTNYLTRLLAPLDLRYAYVDHLTARPDKSFYT